MPRMRHGRHLTKPIRPAELVATLKKWLEKPMEVATPAALPASEPKAP